MTARKPVGSRSSTSRRLLHRGRYKTECVQERVHVDMGTRIALEKLRKISEDMVDVPAPKLKDNQPELDEQKVKRRNTAHTVGDCEECRPMRV
ncbi:hypothetical protein PV325_008984 [Microctonus aethiopoides]|nr:hypothetical protein PV325_008984 [Microctonus aethiopoides]